MIDQQGKDIAKDFIEFQQHFKKFVDPTEFIRDEISKMETRVLVKLSKETKRMPLVTSTEDFKRLETRLDSKIKTAIDKVNEVSCSQIFILTVDD